MPDDSDATVNAQLVTEGLARVAKQIAVDTLASGVVKLAVALNVAQEGA
jgi:hypothetical protein